MPNETVEFRPDWSMRRTAKTFIECFPKLQFKGPGWYFVEGDTLLAVTTNRTAENVWNQKFEEDEVFVFHVWNKRDVSQAFNLVANAPTRIDDR